MIFDLADKLDDKKIYSLIKLPGSNVNVSPYADS